MKSKLNSPFLQMYENYMLSKDHIEKNKISNHWNVFQENFENAILDTESWKYFLRNSLSIGFNDNLHKFSNVDFIKESKFKDGWNLRRKCDFTNLVDEKIIDKAENDKNFKFLNSLLAFCGIDFVMNNLQSNIGSPIKSYFKISFAGYEQYSDKEFFCNNHDLSDVYHFFIINSHIKNLLKSDSITLLEIGGGYGGLISKIKKTYKNIRCIMIDIPEVLVVQNYYLFSEFPNAKFLYLKDLKNKKEKIFDMNFDFLLLPFKEIEKIPKNFINLIINIRSMMEMTTNTLDFYFKHINRIILKDGIFVCINRYEKNNIALKNYPFDLYWKIILSQTSHIQNHVHQLILQRQKFENSISISESLKDFPPIR